LIGELSAVDRQPRSATIQALEPVTGLVMALPEFEAFLQANGRVAVLLMRLLAERLRDADRKRIEFGAQDATGRVAARLVELAERFGKPVDGGIQIALPLSQDELAGWIGSSREAVSKALGVLRSAGWIRTSRLSVVVVDLAALRARAA
jgi:CRP-like cAMP-binding protein